MNTDGRSGTLAARLQPDLTLARGPRAAFECVVKEVLLDSVGYAAITSGIEFQLVTGPRCCRLGRTQSRRSASSEAYRALACLATASTRAAICAGSPRYSALMTRSRSSS